MKQLLTWWLINDDFPILSLLLPLSVGFCGKEGKSFLFSSCVCVCVCVCMCVCVRVIYIISWILIFSIGYYILLSLFILMLKLFHIWPAGVPLNRLSCLFADHCILTCPITLSIFLLSLSERYSRIILFLPRPGLIKKTLQKFFCSFWWRTAHTHTHRI